MNVEESYIKIIQNQLHESPMIHGDIPKTHIDNVIQSYKDYIEEHHNKSNNIGGDYHYLFRKTDNKHI
jgi:phosphoglucomutase